MYTKKRTLSIITYAMALFFLTIAMATTTGSPVQAAVSDEAAMMVPINISDLSEKVRPGVVNIRTVKNVNGDGRVFRHFFGGPKGRRHPFEDFFRATG
jgi:serine protease Do